MSTPNMSSFEQRLVEALHQEASLAMTLTDTPRELRRWRDNQHKRRTRGRIIAVVATAAAAAALILGLTTLGGTTSRRNEPIHKPSVIPPHQTSIQTLQKLSPSVPTTVLHGPGSVDAIAFGSVWGMDTTNQPKYVYRMSEDGTRVLGRTDLHRYIGDPVPSFAVGSVLLVPSVNGPRRDGYVVLDHNGKQTGFIPATAAGAGAGDASGGWVQTDIDQVAQIDSSGRPTGTRVRLPDQSISAIGVGAGAVWVGSVTGELYRLDDATGKITGKFTLPGQPVQVLATDTSVYVATQGYQLLRLDPHTLHVTAVNDNKVTISSWDEIALGPDGSLWIAPDQRGVAQLDPMTLDVLRSVQLSKASRAGGAYGLGLVGGRMFVGDGDNHRVVSFPLK